MPTVELNTEYQNAQRFPAWMMLGIFSAVCMAGVNSKFNKDERDGNVKWVLACTILSMMVGIIGFGGYLVARSLFVGQATEMGLTVCAIALWAAGLPVIMDPENGIAVKNITVLNANLYFFSWLALGAVVFISGSLAQEQLGINIKETPGRAIRWYCLSASSLVVLGSAVRVFLAVPCNGSIDAIESGAFCKRTRLAISLGVISSLAGFGMTYAITKKLLTLQAETAGTAFLLLLWCFGVGYTTFGESPGSQIGNLYFSSWISFLIAAALFGDSFRDFVSGRMVADGGSGAEENGVEANNVPEDLQLDEDDAI